MILYTEFNFSDLYIMAIFENHLPIIGVGVSGCATTTNVYSYNEKNQYVVWYKNIYHFSCANETFYQETPLKKLTLVDFLWEVL